MDTEKAFSSGKDTAGDSWYVDNYILLKDYYDMTISRIAARCVRSGNIALEEYKHYSYVLDVLEEITETGEYILAHTNLYAYVDKKMVGGVNALRKNLQEFKYELEHNATPEMIKKDHNELKKMKAALGKIDKKDDPTSGAGMSMDEVVQKLMNKNNIHPDKASSYNSQKPQGQQPRPQQPQGQQPRPQQPPGQQPRPQQPQGQQPRPQQPQE